MQVILFDTDLLWASRSFVFIFCTFLLGLLLHLVWATAAPECHLESPTKFTRKRNPWCKRPSERPIRRIFWLLLLGWGWGHRNLQPLSGSHLNYLPIHSSPHWYAEPHWRRVTGHQNLRKYTTSRWDWINFKNSCQLWHPPKRFHLFSSCAAKGLLLMLPLWRMEAGGGGWYWVGERMKNRACLVCPVSFYQKKICWVVCGQLLLVWAPDGQIRPMESGNSGGLYLSLAQAHSPGLAG